MTTKEFGLVLYFAHKYGWKVDLSKTNLVVLGKGVGV